MRADRLLLLMQLLQRHGRVTATDLAARLEVSVRTVYRDMEALSVAGVPVYAERGRNGGCVLLSGYKAGVGALSRAEAQALFAWTGQATLSDLGLAEALRTALAKLSVTATDDQLRDAESLRDIVVVDRRPWFGSEDDVGPLPALRAATSSRRRVRLRYVSGGADRPGVRTVDPWGLVENGGRWYLVAAHRGRPRLFRLSRVLGVDVLESAASRPDDLDLAATWRSLRARLEESTSAATTVVVRVHPSVERHVRQVCTSQLVRGETVHRSGEVDGWARLTMRFRARGAAIAIFLGFGDQVVIDEPAEIRDDIVAATRRVVEMYAAPATAGP